MIKRCSLVYLNQFHDEEEDSQSSFSDSQLTMSSSSGSLSESNFKAFIDKNSFFSSENHNINIENVNNTLSQRDQDFELENNFSLSDLKKEIVNTEPDIVYISLCKVMDDKLFDFEDENSHKDVLCWKNFTHKLESNVIFQGYKQNYTSLKSSLTVRNFLLSKTKDYIRQNNNKEFQINRVIFHYIGYNFPDVSNGVIYSDEDRTVTSCNIVDIYKSIGPPIWFIFDCNNAESILSYLKSNSNIVKKCRRPSKVPIDQATYISNNTESFYFFAATSEGETLPDDPRLPKDLFTSCLITPLQTAILAHILRFYRTTFPSNDLLNDRIQRILFLQRSKEKSDGNSDNKDSLMSVLTSILDAIAADLMNNDIYTKLYRADPLTSSLFRGFVLAGYVLHQYNVHPVSHPSICKSHLHYSWQKWGAICDTWIVSGMAPLNLRNTFFTNAIETISNKIIESEDVDISMLCVGCYSFNYIFNEMNKKCFLLLGKYCYTKKNRVRLSAVILLDVMIGILKKSRDLEIIHPLLYILICVFYERPQLIFGLEVQSDFQSLIEILKANTLRQTTVTLILCFIVLTMDHITCFRTFLDSNIHLIESLLKTDNLLSLKMSLMLFSKIQWSFPLIKSMSSCSHIHFQLYSFLFCDSFEIRALANCALSRFMMGKCSKFDLTAVNYGLHTIFDCNYHVRYCLFLLILRFLNSNKSYIKTYINARHVMHSIKDYRSCWCSFSSLDEFKEHSHDFYPSFSIEEFKYSIFSSVYSVVKLFTLDPHHYLSNRGTSLLHYLDSIIDSKECKINEESIFVSNPPMLFDAIIDNVVNEKLYDQEFDFVHDASFIRHNEPLKVDMKSAKLELQFKKRFNPKPKLLSFKSNSTGYFLANKQNQILSLENNSKETGLILFDSNIKRILTYECHNYLVGLTGNGCAYLWDGTSKDYRTCWRICFHKESEYDPIGVLSNSHKLVTSCGSYSVIISDLYTQRIVYEWENPENEYVTSISPLFDDGYTYLLGMQNGTVRLMDTRVSKPVNLDLNVNDNIIDISTRYNEILITTPKALYSYSKEEFNYISCKMFNNDVNRISHSRIHDFYAVSSTDKCPSIYSYDGSLVHSFEGRGFIGSFIEVHSEKPVFSVISNDSNVYIYNFV